MHIFNAITTTLTAASALSTAALSGYPTANNPSISERELTFPKCGRNGAMVCGWDLINRGVSVDVLRPWLCQQLGKCDYNSGDVWNTLWQCTGDYTMVAVHMCGGADSCVIDQFNWQYTCKGGSC